MTKWEKLHTILYKVVILMGCGGMDELLEGVSQEHERQWQSTTPSEFYMKLLRLDLPAGWNTVCKQQSDHYVCAVVTPKNKIYQQTKGRTAEDATYHALKHWYLSHT